MLITQKCSAALVGISLFFCISTMKSQDQQAVSSFWNSVAFGGGIGLNFANGIFSGMLAPMAVYNFNEYFSAGPGLHYSYQKANGFTSSLVGASLVAIANPISQVQLSVELEQAYVSQTVAFMAGDLDDDFWNTALFVGAGYRIGKGAVGLRHNLLFNDGDNMYTTSWAPFVRVLF